MLLQLADLQGKLKESEMERLKEREQFEKDKEGFVSPGNYGHCIHKIKEGHGHF